MYVCNEGHEEIVHLGRSCPCCALIRDIDVLKDDIAELEEKLV